MAPRNRWLLHPWLPIDIRLPGFIGVATMGTYLYLEQTGRLDEAKEQFEEAKNASEGVMKSVSSAVQSFELPSWLKVRPSAGNTGTQSKAEKPGTELPNDAPVMPQESHKKTEVSGAPAVLQASEEPKVVDVKQIDNLMQEALLGREIPVNDPEPEPEQAYGDVSQTVHRLVSQLEAEKLTPEMLRMSEKIRSQVTIKDSTAEASSPDAVPGNVLHTSGVLGIKEDLSTSDLLLYAKRIGMGSSSAVADVVRQQAVLDSQELQAALQKLVQHHSASIAEAHVATAYWKQQAEQGQKILDEVNRGVASVLSEQRHAAHQEVQDALKSKAQELTESYGKDISDELKEQYSKLAQLGVTLKSLHSSLDSRKTEVAQCQLSYVLAGAAGNLHSALQQGCSTREMIEVLDSTTSGDGFVDCVKKSLSSCATEKISSVKELQTRWPAVRRSLQIKANLHSESHPGLLSTSLARAVAALKVSEWASVRVGAAGQTAHTLDVHLAAVDDAISVGNLQDVAVLLEELWKFSSVRHVADDFTLAVKTRVVAEQALSLLHAHAFALATLPVTSATTS